MIFKDDMVSPPLGASLANLSFVVAISEDICDLKARLHSIQVIIFRNLHTSRLLVYFIANEPRNPDS